MQKYNQSPSTTPAFTQHYRNRSYNISKVLKGPPAPERSHRALRMRESDKTHFALYLLCLVTFSTTITCVAISSEHLAALRNLRPGVVQYKTFFFPSFPLLRSPPRSTTISSLPFCAQESNFAGSTNISKRLTFQPL